MLEEYESAESTAECSHYFHTNDIIDQIKSSNFNCILLKILQVKRDRKSSFISSNNKDNGSNPKKKAKNDGNNVAYYQTIVVGA